VTVPPKNPPIPPTVDDRSAPIDDVDDVVGYLRSPSDLMRVVAFALSTLVLLAITRWAEDAIIGLERDLIALVGFVPAPAERFLAGLAQATVLALGLGVLILAFRLKRWRLLGYIVVGNTLAGLVVSGAQWWLDRGQPLQVRNEVAARAGVDLDAVFGPEGIAQLVAAFVILGPFVSARWRRAGTVLVVVLTALRLVLTAHLPSELFLSISIGALCGAAVLLAFGRPDQRPSLSSVRQALVGSGLDVAELRVASVDARGSTPYLVTLADGTEVFAKSISPKERSADLLFRAYRFLRLRNVGDERPFSTLRRTVEHEALVSLRARDVGVRTPRMRAIAEVGADSMVLAYELIDGGSMDRLDPAEITDDLLRGLWEQVAILRRYRIAHRDLRRANVFVDDQGRPWLIDFGFSEVAASDRLLQADVAQLLAALAIPVGAQRAVATAVEALGPAAVGDALAMLQPGALSGATRESLAEQRGLLDELRQAVQESCGVDEVAYVPLDRISAKTVFTLAMVAAVTYFLLPQLADVPGIIDQVTDADWAWFVPVLIMSILTYIGATVSLQGSVPVRLRLMPTYLTQVASSFASKLAPAGLGGMALNTRYLQRTGVDTASAASAVGLNTVAGLATHALLLVTFAVWAGRNAFGSIRLPDPHVLLYGLAAVAVVAAIGFAVPAVRRAFVERLLPQLRQSVASVASVLHRPAKVAMVLGGSAFVTLTYIGALYFATRAFGSDFSFAQVGAVYLVGAAVGTVAPTPGGLGALEAAVIAGLVAAGMDNTVAVPSVFLYRLATYWLPILPGWVCFTHLQRREVI
jgi:undecaprenyl-diphosphatase